MNEMEDFSISQFWLIFGKVILGGGRSTFRAAKDDGKQKWPCKRSDNKDLVGAWKADKKLQGKTHLYMENRTQLLDTNLENVDYIFGKKNSRELIVLFTTLFHSV